MVNFHRWVPPRSICGITCLLLLPPPHHRITIPINHHHNNRSIIWLRHKIRHFCIIVVIFQWQRPTQPPLSHHQRRRPCMRRPYHYHHPYRWYDTIFQPTTTITRKVVVYWYLTHHRHITWNNINTWNMVSGSIRRLRLPWHRTIPSPAVVVVAATALVYHRHHSSNNNNNNDIYPKRPRVPIHCRVKRKRRPPLPQQQHHHRNVNGRNEHAAPVTECQWSFQKSSIKIIERNADSRIHDYNFCGIVRHDLIMRRFRYR